MDEECGHESVIGAAAVVDVADVGDVGGVGAAGADARGLLVVAGDFGAVDEDVDFPVAAVAVGEGDMVPFVELEACGFVGFGGGGCTGDFAVETDIAPAKSADLEAGSLSRPGLVEDSPGVAAAEGAAECPAGDGELEKGVYVGVGADVDFAGRTVEDG